MPQSDGLVIRDESGRWTLVLDSSDAEGLSRRLKTTAVSWSFETSCDQVWITAWNRGREIRMLLYGPPVGDRGPNRWTSSGRALAFEDRRRVARWLKTRRLLAVPDGAGVLAAFLGLDEDALDELNTLTTEPLEAPPPEGARPFEGRWVARLSDLKGAERRRLARQLANELCGAAGQDRVDEVHKLLRFGADPNGPDELGDRALNQLLTPRMVRVLVKAGADPNKVSRRGESPLVSALRDPGPGTLQCVEALLDNGAWA
jgi:hypothetical protein